MINHTNTPTILAVDLDGTLIQSDSVFDSMHYLFKNNIIKFFKILPIYFIYGKEYYKDRLAKLINYNNIKFDYNLKLLNYIKSQKKLGAKLILITAANVQMAEYFQNQLNLFDKIIASEPNKPCVKGRQKAKLLCEQYGENNFIYAGNSRVDLYVWEKAHSAILVNANKNTEEKARALGKPILIFDFKKG